MNPFLISRLLSENSLSECQLSVLVRKHIHRYVDEQNWEMVPVGKFEAGGEV